MAQESLAAGRIFSCSDLLVINLTVWTGWHPSILQDEIGFGKGSFLRVFPCLYRKMVLMDW
jgi:hypothetical protein